MVKVTCQLTDYSDPAKTEIKVHSHWNSNRFVEIEVNGLRYVVSGQDMITACQNAMNTNR